MKKKGGKSMSIDPTQLKSNLKELQQRFEFIGGYL